MNTQTDQQLLQDYAGNRSEAAFAELVRRHIDLVYSAARRMVSDAHLAEDVTQGVFVALSQNARQLAGHPLLPGWLHRTTQNIAANVVRTNVRRQIREQEAVAMHETTSAEPDVSWNSISPHLDDALGKLSESDRDALLLRYFERKSTKEMATALGVSEDAAQKRVSRAVERLRELFSKRGITVGVSGLVLLISAHAVQAAPVGLAGTLSTTIAGGGSVTFLKLIMSTTLKHAAVVTIGILVVAGTGLVVQQQAIAKARTENANLSAKIQNVPPPTTPIVQTAAANDGPNLDQLELTRLRRESAILRARIAELNDQAQTRAARAKSRVSATPIGKTLQYGQTHDVGQATPAAAAETWDWASDHGDTNRMMQLMAFDPETDMLLVQRQLEMSQRDSTNLEALRAEDPLWGVRLVEEQPAENNDRWIVDEWINKDGTVSSRARVRVRLTDTGWKLVIGIDGQTVQEELGKQP